MTLNGQKLFILDGTRRPELQDGMVNRRLSGRLPGYFRTFIRKTPFLSQKIFTFWHITVFAPTFYSFKVFFLETSCYKTVVAKKFEYENGHCTKMVSIWWPCCTIQRQHVCFLY